MTQVQTGFFPIAGNVMDLARSAVNDMLRSTAGQTLTDTKPFTAVYLNASIRRVQRELANNGITSNIRDNVIITPLTPATVSDPSIQVYVDQLGYFDGTSVNANVTLPADLILPLQVWERQTGSAGRFVEMDRPQEGLTSRVPGTFFGQWEWREDRINMTGSTSTEDLRLRYEAKLARIAATDDFTKLTIRILDGEDALAAGVVLQYARTRGSALRQEAKTWFDDEMYQLINRSARQDQRISYRPHGYRSGGGSIDGALSGDYK